MEGSKIKKTGYIGVYRNCNKTKNDTYFASISTLLSDGKYHAINLPCHPSLEHVVTLRKLVLDFIEKNKRENGTKYCTLSIEEIKAYAKSVTPTKLFKPRYLRSKKENEDFINENEIDIPLSYLKSFLLKPFFMVDDFCLQPALYVNPADFFKLINPIDYYNMQKISNSFLALNKKDYKPGIMYSQKELQNSDFSIIVENTRGQMVAFPILFSEDIDINEPILCVKESAKNNISMFLGIEKPNKSFNLITNTYVSSNKDLGVSKDGNIYGTVMYKPDAIKIIIEKLITKKRD